MMMKILQNTSLAGTGEDTKTSSSGKNLDNFEIPNEKRISRNVLKTSPIIYRNGKHYSVENYYNMLRRRKSLDS